MPGAGFHARAAHAHVNLLGWVSLALYGLYHHGVERSSNRLAWTQAACAVGGVPLMAGGLAAYLATHSEAFVRSDIAGSLLVAAGLALFLAVVLADMLRGTAPRSGWRVAH